MTPLMITQMARNAAQNTPNRENAPARRCLFARCSASSIPVPRPQSFGRCDSTSYAYCALSGALFAVGAVMFLFMYLNGGSETRPSNLDDGWLVGPIFMCTGLLLGIKNLLYMRRAKLLFDLLLAQEQRAAERDFHEMESCVHRNASVVTLPPSYDVAITMPSSDAVKAARTSVFSPDSELPSYDEALRLLSDSQPAP
ncbi:unnamed protein product [Notodromas monacha]|uniref:Transmembrane protein n=1 Tax=Notodromas monacha TaxID=399045 RepID=A0A7R9BP13_9CRUS|nr:unnamed protein product [Notodromas monacha]CAG0917531.1 unnamed protein product [Notodromas monacha]